MVEFSFALWYNILLEGDNTMKVQTGYLYHIKDDFFDVVNDENLMTNHEQGKKKTYLFYY